MSMSAQAQHCTDLRAQAVLDCAVPLPVPTVTRRCAVSNPTRRCNEGLGCCGRRTSSTSCPGTPALFLQCRDFPPRLQFAQITASSQRQWSQWCHLRNNWPLTGQAAVKVSLSVSILSFKFARPRCLSVIQLHLRRRRSPGTVQHPEHRASITP